MLKPAKMKKIRIFALKSILPEIIKVLHQMGVMEIRKFRIEGLEDGRPLPFFDNVSTQLVRLRGMLALMDKDVVASSKLEPLEISGSEAISEAEKINSLIGGRLLTIAQEITALNEEISKINTQIKIVEKLEVFKGIDFHALSTKRMTFAVGEIPSAKRDIVRKQLGEEDTETTILAPEEANIILVIYDRGKEIFVERVLSECGFSALQIPEGMRTPEEERLRLKMRLEDGKKALKNFNDERRELSEKYVSRVLGLIELLEIEAARSEISSRFAFSDNLSVMQGWIKETDFGRLSKTLAELFGEYAILEDVPLDEHDQPPIVLDNPAYSHPFEFITKSFSMPNYFELDPTVIYFISLPLIYGVVVGDVFYGLLSLLIASWFLRKFERSYVMTSIASIWYISAFPSIFFGLLFDEWGGASHAAWLTLLAKWGLPIPVTPLYHGVLSRLHDFPLLLGITLLIGAVHIGIGFLLGAYSLWEHHRKHAYAKLAWLGIEIGGAFAVCSGFLQILPSLFLTPSLVLLIVSIGAMVFFEGAIAIFELPSLVGNILSYARIAAVGVSGVVLAEIINEFFMPLPQAGIAAILFVPLLIILHMVNTFIAMFESLIQIGRLNVIEFKSKFMLGGGIPFSPFMLKKMR